MRKFTSTKSVLEGYKAQVEEQESQLARQTVEVSCDYYLIQGMWIHAATALMDLILGSGD